MAFVGEGVYSESSLYKWGVEFLKLPKNGVGGSEFSHKKGRVGKIVGCSKREVGASLSNTKPF